jgi:hypothetical protein
VDFNKNENISARSQKAKRLSDESGKPNSLETQRLRGYNLEDTALFPEIIAMKGLFPVCS